MANNKPTQITCPTCEKVIQWTDEYPDRPFCSARCKLIDLGAWADESHKIPGAAVMDFMKDDNENDSE
jgi:uncharacterized protein